MEDENSVGTKPYKVKDVTRINCKGIVAASLDEVKAKVAEKFGKSDIPNIHLDSDGTEIDDEDYFQTLEPNTELVAVFNGEQWIDPTQYVTITTRRNSADTTDSAEIEHRVHLKKIVSQLKNNLYNVSVLSEPDLEMITNMDPNSVADITGKDFIQQLKEVSGRFLHEKREALDAIELLKLFAKHKGLSIEIAADADSPDQLQTTISTDKNSSDATPTNFEQIDNNSITMKSNQTAESMKSTTKTENCVIQKQPALPAVGIQHTNVQSFEQGTQIGIKKDTPDI